MAHAMDFKSGPWVGMGESEPEKLSKGQKLKLWEEQVKFLHYWAPLEFGVFHIDLL